MMKMERPPKPDWLKKNYKKWGKRFKQKKDLNKNQKFVWATYQKVTVNKILLPILREATKKHCAFCDDKITKGTIEHFRPSSIYPFKIIRLAQSFSLLHSLSGKE